MEKQQAIKAGLKGGIPIALGYLSVSFTFGMMASAQGIPVSVAVVISLTNLTSAGQFAALPLMSSAASLMEMALTQLTINLRYALMSLSLSQKVEPKMTRGERMVVAFGITDEIFALAAAQKGRLSTAYMMALTILPVMGWTSGTWLGATMGKALPVDIRSALGIAIYAMFLAILLPPARRQKAVRQVILIAAFISCLFTLLHQWLPISSGFLIIFCALVAAGYGAWRYPLKEDQS